MIRANVFLVFLGLLIFSRTDSVAQKSWKTIPPADQVKYTPKDEAALAVVNDQIIVLGGRDQKSTSVYNLSSETWEERDPPPVEMHHFQAVTYEGKIYVAGAFTGGFPGEIPFTEYVHL